MVQKKVKMKRVFSLCIFSLPILIFAQSGFVAVGGDYSDASGSISYSVGQIDYKYKSNEAGNITEGIQQVFIDDIETSIYALENNIKINAYPNPSSSFIYLESDTQFDEELQVIMVDLNGKEIIRTPVSNLVQHKINLENISSGMYIINVETTDEIIQSFKIQKK